jgi:hypothetical protein
MYPEMTLDSPNAQGNLMGINPAIAKHPSKGSRAEFEKHFHEVPQAVRDELDLGKLRLADMVVYSIKAVGKGSTVRMFETQDVKKLGIRNISNGKLPKNSVLLVSGIYLLAKSIVAAIPGSPTDEEMMNASFTSFGASGFGALANAEVTLKAKKVTIMDGTSARLWCTDNNMGYPLGFLKLANPRLIEDDVPIELTIDLGTVSGLPADTVIYAGLYGTMTMA